MNCFYKVACPFRTNPLTAGLTVHLCRYSLENRADFVPRLDTPTRHNARSMQSPFFSPRHARTYKMEAMILKELNSPGGIGKQRIAAVNHDISRFQQFDKLL